MALLTAGAVLGVLLTSRDAKGPRVLGGRAFRRHRLLAIAGTALLVFHPLPLVLARDTTGVGLASVFVPFLATEKATIVAYGTLALDVLLVVLVTSLLRWRLFGGCLGRKTWRLLHYGAYPFFFLGLYHALGISRGFGPAATVDPSDPRKVLLGLAAVAVTLLMAWRVFAARRRTTARKGGG